MNLSELLLIFEPHLLDQFTTDDYVIWDRTETEQEIIEDYEFFCGCRREIVFKKEGFLSERIDQKSDATS